MNIPHIISLLEDLNRDVSKLAHHAETMEFAIRKVLADGACLNLKQANIQALSDAIKVTTQEILKPELQPPVLPDPPTFCDGCHKKLVLPCPVLVDQHDNFYHFHCFPRHQRHFTYAEQAEQLAKNL